jgi:hypothetical protein
MAKARNKYDYQRTEEDNRYNELINDEEVRKILEQIEEINKIRYGNNLSNLINKK